MPDYTLSLSTDYLKFAIIPEKDYESQNESSLKKKYLIENISWKALLDNEKVKKWQKEKIDGLS